MSLSILNNIPSLAAQNQLSITGANLQKTLFRLSSGSRINSGADDAAGLAIADGLHANSTALAQSARNANDGVGQLQVADGALAQVTTLLNRAVTLATESATGTVSDQQRGALDAEFTQIKSEIDRIGSTTTYNGAKVFTASSQDIFLSDSGTSSHITVGTGTLSAAGLLGGSASGTLAFSALPAANDTIQISDGTNSHTYKFVAALTGAADEVLIDGSANHVTALQNTLANLVAAVNGGPGAGTVYGALTAANVDVTAAASGTSIVFQATAAGNAVIAGGGAITPTLSGANFAWVDATPFAAGTSTSLTTATNAQGALTAINSAIQSVAGMRGTIGAGVNRLQSASSVINNQVQNLTAAEDGIRAADIAQEVANLTKYSILNQTGISSLAQANQMQQSVLKLLQ
jgi:flagellin